MHAHTLGCMEACAIRGDVRFVVLRRSSHATAHTHLLQHLFAVVAQLLVGDKDDRSLGLRARYLFCEMKNLFLPGYNEILTRGRFESLQRPTHLGQSPMTVGYQSIVLAIREGNDQLATSVETKEHAPHGSGKPVLSIWRIFDWQRE